MTELALIFLGIYALHVLKMVALALLTRGS